MEMAELEKYISKRIKGYEAYIADFHNYGQEEMLVFGKIVDELKSIQEQMQVNWTSAQKRTIMMDIKAKGITLPCYLAHEIRERLDSKEVKGQRSYSIEG